MGGITRRELLAGAGAGAGLLALGGANPLISQAMAKKLPPAELSDIEHVVILIQENRSFDHYFGTLPGVRGFADATVPRSTFEQPGYEAPGYEGVLLPFHPEGGPVPGERCFPDITHSWVPAARELGRRRDGRVRQHASGVRRSQQRARRRWATTSAPTSRSTTRWRKRSRSATTTTARFSGRPTRTA